jgi:hypothetical protein
MSPHPVRLVVRNAKLERSRAATFFRIILLIPHLIWLLLWSLAAIVLAVVNWVAALVLGRTPATLHGWLSAWLRYWLHVQSYAALLTDEWPAFSGREGRFPFDLEVDPPVPQSRLTIFFRGLLAIPAIMVAATLGASGVFGGQFSARQGGGNAGGGASFSGGGVLTTAAFLSWFSILARGRQPEGLRNLAVFALRFTVQAFGYVLLLTPRYPDAAPASREVVCETPGHPVSLRAAEDDGRRSRLTVFFRLPLAIPHLVWLALWSVLALLAAVAGWVAALVTGRLPGVLHRFLSAYVRYGLHVAAFLYVVVNPFPGFTGAAGLSPVDAVLPEAERQGRWTVLARVILAVPALAVTSALGSTFLAVAVLLWFTGLVLGRAPAGLVTLGVFILRYSAQTYAYLLLLTPRYPYSGPWSGASPEPEPLALEPLPPLPAGLTG